MEFFLNVCWLMIALGAFGLWLAGLRVRRKVEAPESAWKRWRSLVSSFSYCFPFR